MYDYQFTFMLKTGQSFQIWLKSLEMQRVGGSITSMKWDTADEHERIGFIDLSQIAAVIQGARRPRTDA